MSRKPYDELPWWCQLLWPWFGPPWYEQVEDLDAHLATHWCALISGECGPPAPEGEDVGDEYDEPIPDMGRPLVVGRDHPSWAEVDAEQRERIGAPPGEDGSL